MDTKYYECRYEVLISRFWLLLVLVLVVFSVLPSAAEAVTIYFTPPPGSIYQGDSFPVEIRLDSPSEVINALEVDIQFPPELLEVLDINRVNSFFSLWPKEPEFFNPLGIVSLAGGLPDPGFQGVNGRVATLNFRAKKTGEAKLVFNESSRALLNDGSGKMAELLLHRADVKILEPLPEQEPRKLEKKPDTIPPEPFTPIISRSKDAYDGKYFVVFSAEDHESGISHYEVQEFKDNVWGEWQVAVSPHVLKNQKGKVKVFVRAVDRQGNEQIGMAEIDMGGKKVYYYSIIGTGVIGLSYFILRRYVRNR